MKKHILRLLVAANAAAILMSCGFEKTANNVEPLVDEAGMLAAPFDEGLTKEEFNKLQKEDDHILVKIDNGDGLPGDKWLNSYGISTLDRLYPSSNWCRADILEGREITKVVKSYVRTIVLAWSITTILVRAMLLVLQTWQRIRLLSNRHILKRRTFLKLGNT